MKALPNFFLAGCQKTGSTWIHQCFREHPEIYVPQDDAIHYFTINYYKGLSWYQQYYQEQLNETMIGDTTPSYIRDPFVPRRIFNYCADAKIIITLRNPIDRAFSHYWHEKKKKKIAFDFSEVIRNYDLYQNWIVPGFYYEHLQKFYEWF
ncbi:MAG: sulfotransferase domain-containing protein, partial [Cyanobacteria bacterium J06621_3]